ncbi:MAG: ABC transporter permease, partial [Acidimicrobiia bacterium]|nr:ABC transporter permease [Acidimicrobiia bacterium]
MRRVPAGVVEKVGHDARQLIRIAVLERRTEIGLRRALGATRHEVRLQFLVEAVLLSILGGAVGVAVGYIGSNFKIDGIPPVIEPLTVVLAFAVAFLTGLFFGLYPANRAASL